MDIQFPAPAIEVKADWIELASINETCTSLPANSIHIEKVSGKCFALAGFYLISKLLNQWIWATFEQQNSTTNPFHCRVLGCIDRFGSIPAMTVGAKTKLSPRLARLMAAAACAFGTKRPCFGSAGYIWACSIQSSQTANGY